MWPSLRLYSDVDKTLAQGDPCMSLRLIAFSTCLLFVVSGLSAGETPDQILERMASSVVGGKAVSMDYLLVQYRSGRRVDAQGTARYHADGKRFVNELKTQAGNIEVDVRMICDGETVWTEVREGEKLHSVQKFSYATLSLLGGASIGSPKTQIQELRERYALSTVRDGKLGEQAVKVLEGKLKDDFVMRQLEAAKKLGGDIASELAKPQLEAMALVRVYVESSSGQIRKTELLNQEGQMVLSFELSNIKRDIELDEALFSYEPPQDAKVMDLDLSLKQAKHTHKAE